MSFDMSAGKPWLRPAPIPPIRRPVHAQWLPGLSDGPDSLEDELSALRWISRASSKAIMKSLAFGVRVSERDKDFFRRRQVFTADRTGTLPASLFTSYSVAEFDVPPLLNGDFDEIVDSVYGGMPVTMRHHAEQHLGRRGIRHRGLRVRFEGSLGRCRFIGNAGVRVVQTGPRARVSARSTAARWSRLHRQRLHRSAAERELQLQSRRRPLLRVGLARVIARPPLDELRASRQLCNKTPPPTATAATRCSIRSSPTRRTFRTSGTSSRSAGGRWPCSTRTSTATSATPPNP